MMLLASSPVESGADFAGALTELSCNPARLVNAIFPSCSTFISPGKKRSQACR